jgi:hypothetical protein
MFESVIAVVFQSAFHLEILGLSIFGSVRFWTKINNHTEFFFFLVFEPNRTENRLNRLISVRFGSVFSPSKPVQTEIMMLKLISDSIHSFSRECYKAYELQTNRKH